MFLAAAAKPIDNKLINLVEEITAKNPELSVLAAREFRYSLHQTPVELSIREPREFNVLEEFIIRAGIEFTPPPTEDQLASILGLDPIFVRSTTANLQALQTLSATSPITVTDEGRDFYAKGSVPQLPYPIQIYAVSDALDGKLIFHAEPLNDASLTLPDLAEFIKIARKINDISALSIEKLQKCIQLSGLDFHVPELGKIVTSCKVLAPAQIIWKNISLFVVFDAGENKLSIEIRSGKQILESASKRMDVLQSKGKIPWQTLCKLSNEAINLEREATLNHKNIEIESRLEKLSQGALKLRDAEITPTFRESLNSAKRQILIYSPSLNKAVINEEFLTLLQKLANRGVWILIGYGVSLKEADVEISISPEVAKKLHAIKTPHGLPSVQVFWLGNSHVKEIIVDQEIHFYGFYDWISCGGENLPQGESVYQVTIPQQVAESYQFLAHRCQNYAQTQWNFALENHDFQMAVESLCVWGALNMQNIALKEIQQSKWWELLPVWLNILLHDLTSQKILDDSINLPTAFSLLSQFSGEEAFMESLQQGWRKVINAIASHKPETALNLLSQQVWAEFIRLNIAQENDSPDKFIMGQSSSPKKKKPKT
ncbi:MULTISPECIES: hypothetical protein [unclassified Nodularia (in: cyanobacteria)]|uniref:hypothetical protein n=1 Tax=unclassified Nodularia (in: cyanobacteria) TaxID=2656917 RepID=UPI00187DE580|nr:MULTISPECIES: hypothetical protein [unclassified Nodularia (in: cyanobacteria)]MBE9198827.1 hypothetical protein [Nodularia sp. LEGE 06071]MCC2692981.1 hypothetical protein [Nodularia sp. LEGE 04288]